MRTPLQFWRVDIPLLSPRMRLHSQKIGIFGKVIPDHTVRKGIKERSTE